MKDKKKICVVTSTRADYGILSRLIELLYQDEDIDLQLIATGMHVSEKFGNTYKEISVPITKKIDIDIEKHPAYSSAIAIEKFFNCFEELLPDMVVLLGDRYEILSAAISAMHANIPIAHLYGGDATYGAIDEAIRHSITKMSHLHFVSCENSRQRVIQLGENPCRVFNLGALGVENIKKIELLKKQELEKSIDFIFNKKNVLVTFHPVTLEGNVKAQFSELLSALDTLVDTNIIITCPNSDTGNNEIFELIQKFVKTHNNSKSYVSLGLKRYLSCMQFVDMVIGNSSSGIYEVPSFKIPTINIGNRQKGRMQAESIINCAPLKKDIINAIEKAYNMDCSKTINPYYKENTAEEIIKVIKNFDTKNILEKEFYDIKFKR